MLATVVVMTGCVNVNIQAPTTPTPSTSTPAKTPAGNNNSSSSNMQNTVHSQRLNNIAKKGGKV
jgi:hypothetical protein